MHHMLKFEVILKKKNILNYIMIKIYRYQINLKCILVVQIPIF